MLTGDVLYGRQALKNKEPWIVPEALKLLTRLVKSDFKVFEWGSGGSTIWFARQCKEVISVEHIGHWFRTVLRWLANDNLENTKLVFAPKKPYHIYADVILKYPDKYFDLIFVDGERSARIRCIENALPKLKPGGVLLLDNSNWADAMPDMVLFDDWVWYEYNAPEHNYLGEPNEWQTSIFFKPCVKV